MYLLDDAQIGVTHPPLLRRGLSSDSPYEGDQPFSPASPLGPVGRHHDLSLSEPHRHPAYPERARTSFLTLPTWWTGSATELPVGCSRLLDLVCTVPSFGLTPGGRPGRHMGLGHC